MRIAVLSETDGAETRVSATPETVKKYKSLGADVVVPVEDRDRLHHAIFLAGTTVTGPKRARERAIDRAGPTATTTRASSGK